MSADRCRHHGGRAPEGFIDFSTPLNPLGAPVPLKKLLSESISREIYSRYPDYEYRILRESIAEFYRLDYEGIIPLNGAAEAFYIAVLSLRPEYLIVFEPTFGDYRCLARALNIPMISVPYIESGDRYVISYEALENLKKIRNTRSLVLISDPNNPTGAILDNKVLEEVLENLRDSVILLDEAFQDLCSECEEGRGFKLAERYENLVIVRSLTKIFSVPGLRIGFLYTSNRSLAELFDDIRSPWNVNSIAENVFARFLREYSRDIRSFVELSRDTIVREVEYVSESLRRLGVKIYRSSTPYILVKHGRTTKEISDLLMRRRIVIRDASVYPYLTPYHARISVRLRDENNILISAYEEVLRE